MNGFIGMAGEAHSELHRQGEVLQAILEELKDQNEPTPAVHTKTIIGHCDAGGLTFRLDQVPAGESWELIAVTVLGTAAQSYSLRENGVLRFARVLAADRETVPGQGVIFSEGGEVQCETTGVLVNITLQVKRRVWHQAVNVPHAGGW